MGGAYGLGVVRARVPAPALLLAAPLLLAAAASGCRGAGPGSGEAKAAEAAAVRTAEVHTAESVLGPMPVPADNPQTPEKAELGRMLFFDPRLSASGKLSCSSCHLPQKGFSDGVARTRDQKGEEIGRNSAGLWNSGYERFPAWDGRTATLEEHNRQAALRLDEDIPALVARVEAIPGYRERFQKIFGAVSYTDITRALAAFQRTLVSWDSAHDRFEAGDGGALSADEHHGRELFFGKAGRARCHVPPLFTDNGFHALGVPQVGPVADDPGRFGVTGDEKDRGAFRTPTLRNIALTGPYMHDGAFAGLHEVIAFYEAGGGAAPNKSPLLKPFTLNAGERSALIAYLKALTHEAAVPYPQLP